MKNPKVGERVVKYDKCDMRRVGKITEVLSDVCAVDFETHIEFVHRTHLIRLKPKKKKEVVNREVIEFECEWDGAFPLGDFEAERKMESLHGKRTKVRVEIL